MTYYSKARKRWRKAEWINGEGRYAVLAWCRVLTVTLWPTMDKAQAAKREIDETACGGMCENRHEIVDLDKPNKGASGLSAAPAERYASPAGCAPRSCPHASERKQDNAM